MLSEAQTIDWTGVQEVENDAGAIVRFASGASGASGAIGVSADYRGQVASAWYSPEILDNTEVLDLTNQVEKLTTGFLNAINHVKELQNRVIELEKKQLVSSTFREEVTDAEAKKEISDFIKDKKREDVSEVWSADVAGDLMLPIEQVSKVMHALEKGGEISKA